MRARPNGQPPTTNSRRSHVPDASAIADQRFEAVLEETGARDPRDHFRERLKALRSEDAEAFRDATQFYEERVTRAIAEGADPLAAWRAFGIRLAEADGPGRAVQIDRSGRSSPYPPEGPADALVVFLPEQVRRPAFMVGAPKALSPPQRATCEILLRGSR